VIVASGQQIAEENVRKFAAWAASKTDGEFRSMVIRGVLSRAEIAKECGFAKSALSQNPRIRDSLRELEEQLRTRGVLPKAAEESTEVMQHAAPQLGSGSSGSREAERLKRLEQENASLRAELEQVKRLLARYTVLQEALAESGRLPR
jgi:hypothetical protein